MSNEFPGLARSPMSYTNDQGLTRFRYVTADNIAVMAGTVVSPYVVVELEKVQRPRKAHCVAAVGGSIARRTFVIPTEGHAMCTPGSTGTDTEGTTWICNSVIGEKTVYRG